MPLSMSRRVFGCRSTPHCVRRTHRTPQVRTVSWCRSSRDPTSTSRDGPHEVDARPGHGRWAAGRRTPRTGHRGGGGRDGVAHLGPGAGAARETGERRQPASHVSPPATRDCACARYVGWATAGRPESGSRFNILGVRAVSGPRCAQVRWATARAWNALCGVTGPPRRVWLAAADPRGFSGRRIRRIRPVAAGSATTPR
jgi:hypothetical protein